MNPVTAPLPLASPDARIDLPSLTCEPLAGAPEAAVLFAAGRTTHARDCLVDACAHRPGDVRAWTMLFELHRMLDEHQAFHALLPTFARRFPASPMPAWRTPAAPAPGMVALSGVLAHAADLEPLLAHARTRGVVGIDFGAVTRIDYGFAPQLCATLRLFTLQSKRVIVANAAELHAQLLAVVGLPAAVAVLPPRGAVAGVAPAEEAALEAA